MNSLIKSTLIIVSALGLVACGSEDRYADLRDRMEKIKTQPKGRIKPPPEFKTYNNFIYSASLLRSPFQPPIDVQPVTLAPEGKQVTPDFNRTKEQLEEYSIDALAMVGTINKPDQSLEALVRDNQARIHRIVVGNYLGRNHGLVTAVFENKVDVLELIPDGQDGWVERPRSMVLRAD